MSRKFFSLSLVTIIFITMTESSAIAKYEEPKYQVLESHGDIEFRQYEDRIAAEVVTEGEQKRALDEGFVILSGYISGKNVRKRNVDTTAPPAPNSDVNTDERLYRSENISMTVPVTAFAAKGNKWTIGFFMPSKYSLETLPTPDNEHIKLVQVEAEKFAVLKFSGFSSKKNFARKATLLTEFLAKNKINTVGPEVNAYYDPPWILPFSRRNEVMIPISQ